MRFEIETDEPELWEALVEQMRERRHKVRLYEDGCCVEHPLSERAAGTLLDCGAHRWLSDCWYSEDPFPPPGDYWMELVSVGQGDDGYECILTPADPPSWDGTPVGEA